MIVVLTALRFEAAALRRLACQRAGEIRVVCTGAGPVAAARRAAALLEAWRPQRVLGCGFCGALERAARPGDLAVPAWIVGAGGEPPLPVTWSGPWPAGGTMLSAPRVVASPRAKAELAARSGARWVDQEGYAWARAAADRDVPFALLRVVLDGADEALPHWREPASWPRLWHLPGRALEARGRLAVAVQTYLAFVLPSAGT